MEVFGFDITEWVGYAAMLALLISFLMKDVKRLRQINTLGCALFVAYGFLLNISWPIVITNTAIIGINLYYLVVNKN